MEMQYGQFAAEDVFVLCSDGLTAHVGDDEIHRSVAAHLPQQACDALVALALERGGTDNVTVLVVRCRADYDPADAAILA
jgi:protein phosphatase